MSSIGLWFYILFTLTISFWNGVATGVTNKETKVCGFWSLPRLTWWSGAFLSAFGFGWCYLLGYYSIAISGGWHTIEDAKWAMDLGFVVFYPMLMLACINITIQQWARTFREGGFLNWGASIWNTYATMNNIRVGAQHYGTALGNVSGGFSGGWSGSSSSGSSNGDAAKGAGGVLLLLIRILVVVTCFVLGAVTTWLIAKWAEKKFTSDMEQAEFDRILASAKKAS